MLREHPLRAGARACARFLPLLCAVLGAACLVDLDHRCGEHQHYDAEQAYCACDSDYALTGTSCVACGEHELGSSDGCICQEGFVRDTPDSACEAPKDEARAQHPCPKSQPRP
jgi:hypothetical protein